MIYQIKCQHCGRKLNYRKEPTQCRYCGSEFVNGITLKDRFSAAVSAFRNPVKEYKPRKNGIKPTDEGKDT